MLPCKFWSNNLESMILHKPMINSASNRPFLLQQYDCFWARLVMPAGNFAGSAHYTSQAFGSWSIWITPGTIWAKWHLWSTKRDRLCGCWTQGQLHRGKKDSVSFSIREHTSVQHHPNSYRLHPQPRNCMARQPHRQLLQWFLFTAFNGKPHNSLRLSLHAFFINNYPLSQNCFWFLLIIDWIFCSHTAGIFKT